jgi:hypothetical protein
MTVRRIVIASSTGNRNALAGIAGCIKISFAEHFVVPACAYRVDTNIRLVLFAPMPQGIKLLRHQKYAKMLYQSSKGPFTQSPYISKKQ